jgi:hypothetical protein
MPIWRLLEQRSGTRRRAPAAAAAGPSPAILGDVAAGFRELRALPALGEISGSFMQLLLVVRRPRAARAAAAAGLQLPSAAEVSLAGESAVALPRPGLVNGLLPALEGMPMAQGGVGCSSRLRELLLRGGISWDDACGCTGRSWVGGAGSLQRPAGVQPGGLWLWLWHAGHCSMHAPLPKHVVMAAAGRTCTCSSSFTRCCRQDSKL